MKKFTGERGFLGPLYETSAKTGEGCDQLREAVVQAIDWKSIPETMSPALYHRLKQEILTLRDSGLVLIRLSELKQRMEMTLPGEKFELAELEAVVGLLAGPGMIQRLDFGGFILLRPEVLSRYAAVVRKVRRHPQELGCIREDELLAGDLDYQDSAWGSQRTGLPAFLKTKTWVDMRHLQKPKDESLYRLVCGILGRPPGDSPAKIFGVRDVVEWQELSF